MIRRCRELLLILMLLGLGACGGGGSGEGDVLQTVTITTVEDDSVQPAATIDSGGATRDTTPKLSGTVSTALTDDHEVSILGNGLLLGKATVTTGLLSSVWIFTPAPPLSTGVQEFKARVVRITDGKVGTDSKPYTITITNNPPDTPVTPVVLTTTIDTIQNDSVDPAVNIPRGGSTLDTTPKLSGTLSATLPVGHGVRIYGNNSILGTASVTGNTWVYTPSPQPAGEHVFKAVVMRDDGQQGPASPTYTITINSPPTPPTPVTLTATISNIQNDSVDPAVAIASGGSTLDTTPRLSGTLSGALPSGHEVRILGNSMLLGTATPTGSGWVYTPATLPTGVHVFKAVVMRDDGQQGPASPTYTITINSPPTPPTPPTPVTLTATISSIQNDSDVPAVTIANGGSTLDTTPKLSGTLSATLPTGHEVRILGNDMLLGTATLTGSGWVYTPATLPTGVHVFKALVRRVADEQEGPVSATYTITINSPPTPPAPVSLTATISSIQNDSVVPAETIASGGSTLDTTPKLSGTLSATLPTGHEVRILGNDMLLGTATVTGSGWVYTPATLPIGEHVFKALVRRVADGQEGPVSATYTITINSPPTPPAPVTLTATISSIQNDSVVPAVTISNGGSTLDTTPILSGTLSATLPVGHEVRIYGNNNLLGTAAVTGTTWVYTPSARSTGEHVFKAVVRRVADGQEGPASANYTITINSPPTPPAPVSLTATISSIQNDSVVPAETIASGGSTLDTTPRLSGTVSATLPSGHEVRIYGNNNLLGTATVAGNTWAFTPGTLPTGVHVFKAAVRRVADGQEGPASATYTLTINAPPAPVSLTATISDVQKDDVGPAVTIIPGGSTLDATPRLSGAVNGVLSGHGVRIYDNNTRLGDATVTGSGWVYTPVTLPTGAHAFKAVVVRGSDGQEGTASSLYRITVISSAAPVAPKTPHSGITSSQCYKAGSDTLVDCTSALATSLNAHQDGMRTLNVMGYSAVPNGLGGTYPTTDCVKDEVTGLIWEGKTSSGLRAGSKTYTHHDVAYGSTQAAMDADTNAYGYVAAVNNSLLCGFGDWRLPTLLELQSLVDYSRSTPGPVINTTWFPNTFAGPYHSSTPYAGGGQTVWGLNFISGTADDGTDRTSSYPVRLVRTPR